MLESSHFNFNGESSRDKGVQIVHTGGLYNETFKATRKIVETIVPGRKAPYFKRVDEDPLSFSLTIWIKDWEKRNNLRAISRWLFQDFYKPLYFESEPDRIYYVIFQGKSDIIHNGLKEGYITLNVRANSPDTFSNVHNDKFTVNGTKSIQYSNEGDFTIRPFIKLKMRSAGNVRIKNEANGQEMIINNLLNEEEVYIDCVNEAIVSGFEERLNRYLFDNHNDVWLDWELDDAIFTFTGNFDIEFKYEFIYNQEYNALSPGFMEGC